MFKIKKGAALIAVLCMVLSMMPAGRGWSEWTWGSITSSAQQTVAPGTVYHSVIADTPAGPQRIHAIEVSPGNENVVLRAGKSKGNVYGVQTVLGITNEMEKDFPGQVVAGINADFFDLGYGVPFGVFVDEGRILSTPPQYSSSFGIKNDGTPFVQTHGTIMNKILVIGDKKIEMNGLNNRIKEANALMMYTSDYGASTRVKSESLEIVCRIVSGEPKHGDIMELTVEAINRDVGNTEIQPGTLVISATGNRIAEIEALQVGNEISAFFQFNEFWQDVKFAVGGNYTILQDGKIQEVSDGARNPRTIIGHKADGTIVFYTIDGRQSGYSAGATLKQAATIMRDMGCVAALNLDGGGSTTFVLRSAGSMTRKVVNSPSEKSQRQVANAVVLINTSEKYPSPTALFPQPTAQSVLKGGAYNYSVAGAMDPNFQPHEPQGPYEWYLEGDTASVNVIDENGVLLANEAGSVQVYVKNDSAIGVTGVRIVDTVDTITSNYKNMTLEAEAETELSVILKNSGANVSHTNDLLSWSADEELGEIIAPGVIKTGKKYAEGNIYVSYNGVSLTIPATVDGEKPVEFSDLAGYDWAAEPILNLAELGIIRGVSKDEFAPANPIKRADFMLLLVRMMGIDTSVKPAENFSDVPKTAYYYNELAAAKAMGIATGVSETEFAPERNITRQEMFTLVHRVMKKMGYLPENSGENTGESLYADAGSISGYAQGAIAVMSELKLVQGDSKNCVNPKNPAIRAEAAVFIDRVNSRINPVETETDDKTSDSQEDSASTSNENIQEPIIENQVNGELIENDETSEETGDLYTGE